jgi:antitoxin component of MazEF toxin-antitoxin module
MGYKVKIQKVDRPTNRSYYVNLPVALAESIDVEKGEALQLEKKTAENIVNDSKKNRQNSGDHLTVCSYKFFDAINEIYSNSSS